jgi:hypothetical protein
LQKDYKHLQLRLQNEHGSHCSFCLFGSVLIRNKSESVHLKLSYHERKPSDELQLPVKIKGNWCDHRTNKNGGGRIPSEGAQLWSSEARVREKERQLRPDPRRPCRTKAVAVGGFSGDSWISSKARVSVSGASELTDEERRRRRGHQAEEDEGRRERREDAIRKDAAMADSFAGSPHPHHGDVAKGTS